MDTEMKEGTKVVEGLVNSKHMVKNLTEEEIDKIVKEMGWEEEKKEDEDKEIEEKEVKGRNDLFNVPQDSRNALGLIKSILKNNKVVEEFRALPNKKKWWKPAKDANLAKRLILMADDVIEGRYWNGGDLEGKDRWKAVTEILLEASDLERVKEASNKARMEKEKRKETEGKKIKEMKRQAEERKKKEEEALKEAEKLAAQAQGVREF